MKFEWDINKEERNIQKHGIDFTMAATLFLDSGRIEFYDEEHSNEEDRFITIGRLPGTLTVITLVYTERGDSIRIISARISTKEERSAYYEKQN